MGFQKIIKIIMKNILFSKNFEKIYKFFFLPNQAHTCNHVPISTSCGGMWLAHAIGESGHVFLKWSSSLPPVLSVSWVFWPSFQAESCFGQFFSKFLYAFSSFIHVKPIRVLNFNENPEIQLRLKPPRLFFSSSYFIRFYVNSFRGCYS